MHRIVWIAAVVLAVVLVRAADARTVSLSAAPEGYPILVAAGPSGRAIAAWGTTSAIRFAERSAGGDWSLPRAISSGDEFPVFAAMGPGRAATILAYDHGASGSLLALRGVAGAFGEPAVVARGRGIQLVEAAADRHGDIAALVAYHDTFQPRLALVTAARDGQFSAPQPIEPDNGTVAVGGDGRVVVAYIDRGGVYARTATVGEALGAPQRLTAQAAGRDIVSAVDDAGNATVAFGRRDDGDRDKRAALVAARARPGRRFGSPVFVAHGVRPMVVPVFGGLEAAAAGTTTALAWDPFGSQDSGDPNSRGLGVVIARGSGRFGPAQWPSAPDVWTRALHADATAPRLAVDAAGDVLLAYSYNNAVHATQRVAGSARFAAARVLTRLGRGIVPNAQTVGNLPAIALLADRTPLFGYHGMAGGVLVADRIDGSRPDLLLPRVRVTLPPGSAERLRARNDVEVKVTCAHACVVGGRATLRTPSGRTIAFHPDSTGLGAGETLSTVFAFDPTRGAKTAGDGARLRVTIRTESASGVARNAVAELELGT